MEVQLKPRQTPGSSVTRSGAGWRLFVPPSAKNVYSLAQLDDYAGLPRRKMYIRPPWEVSLRARVSTNQHLGTWGFGLWNDPFGFSLGLGGNPGRLPALPQTAWFMYASQPNWLDLRGKSSIDSDQATPANGFFAGTTRSPYFPSLLLAPALLGIPLCAIRPVSQLLRRLASKIIRQAGVQVNVDVTKWHEYSIQWLRESCHFLVDGEMILVTDCAPRPPLGLVIWLDNQFAAWTPEGKLRWGILENEAAWMEVEKLKIGYSPLFTVK